MLRTMTLMNVTGDVTIGWDERDAARILPIIQAKLDAGVTFFILAPPDAVSGTRPEIRLKTIEQIGSARRVILSDREFEAAFSAGIIGVVERTAPPIAPTGAAPNDAAGVTPAISGLMEQVGGFFKQTADKLQEAAEQIHYAFRPATTAEEVVKNDSVATVLAQGG